MSTQFNYETAAMHGDPAPDGLTFPDQCMFQALSALYARYRLGKISREQASIEKRQLIRDYETAMYRWELGNHYAEIIKRTEAARNAYRLNRTPESADRLLQAIDGVTFREG